MKLSILIPTIPERFNMLNRVLDILYLQERPDFEICIDTGNYSTGAKRNNLLKNAKGDYVVFIDDDDTIPDYYIDEIYKALKFEPDVVGFCLYQYKEYNLKAISKNSFQHELYNEEVKSINGKPVIVFYRTPTHLNPIRREIAVSIGFSELTIGEDRQFIDNIRPMVKTEYYIGGQHPDDSCSFLDLPMYFYLENEGKKISD